MAQPTPTASHASPPSFLVVGLALAAVYIIWGTTYLAIKIAIAEVGPYYLLGLRLIVAGSLMMVVMRLLGQPMPTLRQWRSCILLGFLMLDIGIGAVSVAERSVSSGATVALISIQPLSTALWSMVFGRRPRAMEWVAIGIGVVGTAVMIMGQDFQASALGTSLILLGVVTWAFASNIASKLEMPAGAMGFAAEMLAGGLMALPISAVLGERWVLPQNPHVWAAWAYLVVFGSIIAFSAYRFLVERVSPTLASTYAYVNPPVALFVGWWIGSEHFSANTFIGLGIVLSAVALHAWSWTRTRATSRVTTQMTTGVSTPAASLPVSDQKANAAPANSSN